MAHLRKILLLLSLLALKGRCLEGLNQTEQAVEELIQSETKDGKLEIVKRIKKINPDGSYTIGYEADDGSFKIESRDVLGNIKGTYGFVDDEGEIKRVSYSSSNASDVFPNKSQLFPASSVVQRIPKSTTARPISSTSSTSAPASTTPLSVIQSIARRRVTQSSTSTTTARPNVVVYSSAAPRVLLQRPSLSKLPEAKSEVQINRPEASIKRQHFEDIKPVTEEFSEVRSNLLRRQTLGEPGFNSPFVHNDDQDVYNSVTSRPLFTTSRPPVRLGLTTTAPKPLEDSFQRHQLEEVESNTAVNKVGLAPTPEPLVAIRHPFQQGAILVPLSQLQNRILPVENMQEVYQARQNYAERQQVKRLTPAGLRPLPVQVDANGFIHQMPSTPYPITITPTELPSGDIDQIQPPVSTRDFQTLLNHLIRRQKMLETISELMQREKQFPGGFRRYQPRQQVGVRLEEEVPGGYEYQDERQYVGRRRASRGYQPEVTRGRGPEEEYLPAEVRESLLLRMLKLAMNPALPLQEDEDAEPQQVATAATLQYRKLPMRNVEIIGEEQLEDTDAKKRRAKRYKDEDMEYME
ncbi:uncharacterized protein LOC109538787 [Dendroctonus ponderosae]